MHRLSLKCLILLSTLSLSVRRRSGMEADEVKPCLQLLLNPGHVLVLPFVPRPTAVL